MIAKLRKAQIFFWVAVWTFGVFSPQGLSSKQEDQVAWKIVSCSPAHNLSLPLPAPMQKFCRLVASVEFRAELHNPNWNLVGWTHLERTKLEPQLIKPVGV